MIRVCLYNDSKELVVKKDLIPEYQDMVKRCHEREQELHDRIKSLQEDNKYLVDAFNKAQEIYRTEKADRLRYSEVI